VILSLAATKQAWEPMPLPIRPQFVADPAGSGENQYGYCDKTGHNASIIHPCPNPIPSNLRPAWRAGQSYRRWSLKRVVPMPSMPDQKPTLEYGRQRRFSRPSWWEVFIVVSIIVAFAIVFAPRIARMFPPP